MEPAASEELVSLARRLFWWKEPEEALGCPGRLLAQVMVWGTWEDVAVARRHWSDHEFRAVLKAPPPGLFDARSWAYWHYKLGMSAVPPMPNRKLE